ncbi:MAG TPA: hypothetical protein VN689_07485 [Burkholderiales bacterium]|jgi:hypothetical protein|nr:hypothetical protein [Burkholderiales bacterium]
MKSVNFLPFLLASGLAACGSSAPPPPTAAAQPAQPLPNSNVFSTDLKALQKAKDVQKTVDQQKTDTDKQLQDAEGH